MAVFQWPQAMDADFPLAVLEYRSTGDTDRMHWHEYFEIVLCLEGSGRFLFGPHDEPIAPGDVFVVDDSQPHVARADAGRSLRLLLVLFRPELIAAPGCRSFDSGYLVPFRSADGRSRRVAAGTPLADELSASINELAAVAGRHDPRDRHLLDANLRRVLGTLLHDHGCAGPDERGDAARREQLRPVLSYVEQHCQERVTLQDVAEVVHLSPSRLRHLFRHVSGIGFKEYATRVRIAEAKRLLLATDMSVESVAQAVGYTNLHQFYVVFERYCAMRPAVYRRSYTPDGATPAPAGR